MNEKWHANHRIGMAAAAAKTAARRLPGPVMAEVKRRNRERYPCKVKGCKRTAYKGAICKGHWDMIPHREKIAATVAVFDAQLKATARHHRRFLRDLNAGVYGATS
jgi:hypothetical protein